MKKKEYDGTSRNVDMASSDCLSVAFVSPLFSSSYTGLERAKWRVTMSLSSTVENFHSLVSYRDLFNNDLTALPPGVFDSLSLLTFLYVPLTEA